jgi:putative ABC transport system substrate-binding protein
MKKITLIVCLMIGLLATQLLAGDLNLGVAWEGKSGMANRVFSGMEKALTENAPQIKLDIRKELADITALAAVVAEFEQTKQGMVILRSSGTQLLGKRNLSIPSFIGGTNNPVELGAATSLSQPVSNLTGVTYYIPAKVKLETFRQVYPAFKNYLLLVEKNHPGSPIDAGETAEAAPGLGLTGKTVSCATVDEALAAISAAGEDVSIILGSQAILIDSAARLVDAAGTRPVFSYSERPVKDGALGGVVADDTTLGHMLGMMVIEVLVKGKPVGEMPIQTDPAPKLYLNSKTIERLKLKVPYKILSLATIVE